jgi:hypothetical protein
MPIPGFAGAIRVMPVRKWSVLPGSESGFIVLCFELQFGGALCFPLANVAAETVLQGLQ